LWLARIAVQPSGSGWLFAAALFNAGAILSLFFALNIGKIVEIETLVACNPLLTL
jgi:hypothetical protein